MLKRTAVSALGALRRLTPDSARLFSSRSYPIVDHTFDAIVVGAGEGLGATPLGWSAGAVVTPLAGRPQAPAAPPRPSSCRWRRSARGGGPERERFQHSVSQWQPSAAALRGRRRGPALQVLTPHRHPLLQMHHQAVPHAQPHRGRAGRHQCCAGQHDGCAAAGVGSGSVCCGSRLAALPLAGSIWNPGSIAAGSIATGSVAHVACWGWWRVATDPCRVHDLCCRCSPARCPSSVCPGTARCCVADMPVNPTLPWPALPRRGRLAVARVRHDQGQRLAG